MIRRTGLALAAVVLFAAVGDAAVLKFDFGRKDRPRVMNGFAAVTVYDDYSDEKGFGWVGVKGEVNAGWLEERSPLAGCCRRSADEECSVDDLACDYIGGGGVFGVKVPNGKYVVWMMVGDWGAYEFYPRGKYTVLAEGKVIGELDHSTWAKFKDDFWRHRDDEYKHGANLFEKYVEPRFRKYTAEVEVTDGRLELQVRKDAGPGSYVGPLNAAVVFPVEEKAQGEQALKDIAAERKAWFDKRYTVVDTSEFYIGDTSREAGERGFVVWPVAAGDEMSLGSRLPRGGESLPLTAMVSLGEMEPAVLCVRPLTKDPGRFTCTVGPLKGDKGDVLPASTVNVRVVKPWEMLVRADQAMVDAQAKKKINIRVDQTVVAATPYFLVERNGFEGAERLNRHFWLTVKMPTTALSSTYTADVTVSAMGKECVRPLTVTVLPFQLPRAKEAVSVNYGAPDYPRWFDDSKDTYWDVVEKDMKLQYDYGMTTVALLGGFRIPKTEGEENSWEKFIGLYQKLGFESKLVQGGTMNLYSGMPKDLGTAWDKPWQDAYVKVFRDYEAVAKRMNQKVIYSIGDETTNDGREGLIIQVGKVAKARMDDLDLMSDINGYRELMGLAPNIDACGFNNGWGGSYQTNRQAHALMTRDVIERVKSLGSTPWFINGGKGRYPYGIWFWKTTKWGQAGKIEWMYDASSGDHYNPFDGTSKNDFGSLVLPDQVCTVLWELSREGVDDLRYLERLDDLIAKNKDTPDPFLKGVLARATYVRDFWHDCVADRFTSAGNPDGSGDYAGNAWPADRLNAMRREVAQMICMFEGKVAPGVYGDVMLVDGDTGENPDRQLAGSVRSLEKGSPNATQGKNCFKLTFPKGKGYADQYGRPPEKDWRGYRRLVLDVVNPQAKPVTITLNLRDQTASNLGNYDLRHVEKLVCAPGKNTFAVPLLGMKASGADYTFDLSCLFSFFFTTDEGPDDVVVYLDNMRLTPK